MKNQKKEFIKNVETFETDSNDLKSILKSTNFSRLEKKEIIVRIGSKLINSNELAEIVYKIDDRRREKNYDYILNMIISLESMEKRITILNEQNEYISDDELVELLNFLPEDYSKISNLDGRQTLLIENDYNKIFIEILNKRSFITSYKIDKNNKKKIRLWIKDKK